MKENVFLGKDGLTSTSANYYANIAQELIQSAIQRLNSVKFYQTSIKLIDGNADQLMTVGLSSADFIYKDLEKLAKMNSFCAWVREAIKKKDGMLAEVPRYSIEKWAEDNSIELPESPAYPTTSPKVDEQDIIDSWNAEKRNKYLTLEAFASTYGKYIHPKGAFSKARQDAHFAANNPIYTEGSGRDLILYYQASTIEVEKIDEMFMSLQDIYRSYEKELNAMKAELKEAVNKANIAIGIENQKKLADYKVVYDMYCLENEKLNNQFDNWKISEQERISQLKITLPTDLVEIFEEIRKQGDLSSK